MADDLIVQTQYGQVQGRTQASVVDGSTYNLWLGIPYAAPPVGNLRFQVFLVVTLVLKSKTK